MDGLFGISQYDGGDEEGEDDVENKDILLNIQHGNDNTGVADDGDDDDDDDNNILNQGIINCTNIEEFNKKYQEKNENSVDGGSSGVVVSANTSNDINQTTINLNNQSIPPLPAISTRNGQLITNQYNTSIINGIIGSGQYKSSTSSSSSCISIQIEQPTRITTIAATKTTTATTSTTPTIIPSNVNRNQLKPDEIILSDSSDSTDYSSIVSKTYDFMSTDNDKVKRTEHIFETETFIVPPAPQQQQQQQYDYCQDKGQQVDSDDSMDFMMEPRDDDDNDEDEQDDEQLNNKNIDKRSDNLELIAIMSDHSYSNKNYLSDENKKNEQNSNDNDNDVDDDDKNGVGDDDDNNIVDHHQSDSDQPKNNNKEEVKIEDTLKDLTTKIKLKIPQENLNNNKKDIMDLVTSLLDFVNTNEPEQKNINNILETINSIIKPQPEPQLPITHPQPLPPTSSPKLVTADTVNEPTCNDDSAIVPPDESSRLPDRCSEFLEFDQQSNLFESDDAADDVNDNIDKNDDERDCNKDNEVNNTQLTPSIQDNNTNLEIRQPSDEQPSNINPILLTCLNKFDKFGYEIKEKKSNFILKLKDEKFDNNQSSDLYNEFITNLDTEFKEMVKEFKSITGLIKTQRIQEKNEIAKKRWLKSCSSSSDDDDNDNDDEQINQKSDSDEIIPPPPFNKLRKRRINRLNSSSSLLNSEKEIQLPLKSQIKSSESTPLSPPLLPPQSQPPLSPASTDNSKKELDLSKYFLSDNGSTNTAAATLENSEEDELSLSQRPRPRRSMFLDVNERIAANISDFNSDSNDENDIPIKNECIMETLPLQSTNSMDIDDGNDNVDDDEKNNQNSYNDKFTQQLYSTGSHDYLDDTQSSGEFFGFEYNIDIKDEPLLSGNSGTTTNKTPTESSPSSSPIKKTFNTDEFLNDIIEPQTIKDEHDGNVNDNSEKEINNLTIQQTNILETSDKEEPFTSLDNNDDEEVIDKNKAQENKEDNLETTTTTAETTTTTINAEQYIKSPDLLNGSIDDVNDHTEEWLNLDSINNLSSDIVKNIDEKLDIVQSNECDDDDVNASNEIVKENIKKSDISHLDIHPDNNIDVVNSMVTNETITINKNLVIMVPATIDSIQTKSNKIDDDNLVKDENNDDKDDKKNELTEKSVIEKICDTKENDNDNNVDNVDDEHLSEISDEMGDEIGSDSDAADPDDKEINRLLNFNTLNNKRKSNNDIYYPPSKKPKDKSSKSENKLAAEMLVETVFNEPPVDSNSESDDNELTEEQYLKQFNITTKEKLLKNLSSSGNSDEDGGEDDDDDDEDDDDDGGSNLADDGDSIKGENNNRTDASFLESDNSNESAIDKFLTKNLKNSFENDMNGDDQNENKEKSDELKSKHDNVSDVEQNDNDDDDNGDDDDDDDEDDDDDDEIESPKFINHVECIMDNNDDEERDDFERETIKKSDDLNKNLDDNKIKKNIDESEIVKLKEESAKKSSIINSDSDSSSSSSTTSNSKQRRLNKQDKKLFDKNLFNDLDDFIVSSKIKSTKKSTELDDSVLNDTESVLSEKSSLSSDVEILDTSMFDKGKKNIEMNDRKIAKIMKSTRKKTDLSTVKSKLPSSSIADDCISLSSDSDLDLEEVVDGSGAGGGIGGSGSGGATGGHGSMGGGDDNMDSLQNKSRGGTRRILRTDQLAGETKLAQKEEADRVKRLEKKTERLNQLIANQAKSKAAGDGQKTESTAAAATSQKPIDESDIILDYDSKKKMNISVHPDIVKYLKDHQIDGVKFMYDSCYGSVDSLEKYPGSGCILAHCMGLGKTLQLIALLHTLIRYPQLKTNKILVICPKSTIMNWADEIQRWLGPVKGGPTIKVYHFPDSSDINDKLKVLRDWQSSGKHGYSKAGCFLIGYEAFRSLVSFHSTKKRVASMSESQLNAIKKKVEETLLKPGADLVICDEGHMIKNRKSSTSLAVNEIKTRRRIILTGTPIQNNLKEYYSMVNFIKPSFLGTEKEFANLYANPIRIGQHKDSSMGEIKFMKQRSFVLHKKLSKFVQRREAALLKTFLPEKYEYVLFIPMTDVQNRLYEHFLENNPMKEKYGGKSLIPDYTFLRKIWTHPKVLENAWINALELAKKKEAQKPPRRPGDSEDEQPDDVLDSQIGRLSVTNDWWRSFIQPEDLESLLPSNKLRCLFEILKICHENREKCLIFSAFVAVLNVVEFFMKQIHKKSPMTREHGLDRYRGPWVGGQDYYRLDGKTPKSLRHVMITNFNNPSNVQTRCFLISAKAGGQGINLIGANRVVLLDTSWNPSNDQQNIFRVFRLGQKSKCFIYRLLAMGTMEEKVYSRSVTKQAMSFRVVDEQQIDRHYSMAELTELYTLSKPDYSNRPTPVRPFDNVLASLLHNYPDLVYKYHEHDSLLEKNTEQDLSEEEKADAWAAYENDVSLKNQYNMPGPFLDGMYNSQSQFNLNLAGYASAMLNSPYAPSFGYGSNYLNSLGPYAYPTGIDMIQQMCNSPYTNMLANTAARTGGGGPNSNASSAAAALAVAYPLYNTTGMLPISSASASSYINNHNIYSSALLGTSGGGVGGGGGSGGGGLTSSGLGSLQSSPYSLGSSGGYTSQQQHDQVMANLSPFLPSFSNLKTSQGLGGNSGIVGGGGGGLSASHQAAIDKTMWNYLNHPALYGATSMSGGGVGGSINSANNMINLISPQKPGPNAIKNPMLSKELLAPSTGPTAPSQQQPLQSPSTTSPGNNSLINLPSIPTSVITKAATIGPNSSSTNLSTGKSIESSGNGGSGGGGGGGGGGSAEDIRAHSIYNKKNDFSMSGINPLALIHRNNHQKLLSSRSTPPSTPTPPPQLMPSKSNQNINLSSKPTTISVSGLTSGEPEPHLIVKNVNAINQSINKANSAGGGGSGSGQGTNDNTTSSNDKNNPKLTPIKNYNMGIVYPKKVDNTKFEISENVNILKAAQNQLNAIAKSQMSSVSGTASSGISSSSSLSGKTSTSQQSPIDNLIQQHHDRRRSGFNNEKQKPGGGGGGSNNNNTSNYMTPRTSSLLTGNKTSNSVPKLSSVSGATRRPVTSLLPTQSPATATSVTNSSTTSPINKLSPTPTIKIVNNEVTITPTMKKSGLTISPVMNSPNTNTNSNNNKNIHRTSTTASLSSSSSSPSTQQQLVGEKNKNTIIKSVESGPRQLMKQIQQQQQQNQTKKPNPKNILKSTTTTHQSLPTTTNKSQMISKIDSHLPPPTTTVTQIGSSTLTRQNTAPVITNVRTITAAAGNRSSTGNISTANNKQSRTTTSLTKQVTLPTLKINSINDGSTDGGGGGGGGGSSGSGASSPVASIRSNPSLTVRPIGNPATTQSLSTSSRTAAGGTTRQTTQVLPQLVATNQKQSTQLLRNTLTNQANNLSNTGTTNRRDVPNIAATINKIPSLQRIGSSNSTTSSSRGPAVGVSGQQIVGQSKLSASSAAATSSSSSSSSSTSNNSNNGSSYSGKRIPINYITPSNNSKRTTAATTTSGGEGGGGKPKTQSIFSASQTGTHETSLTATAAATTTKSNNNGSNNKAIISPIANSGNSSQQQSRKRKINELVPSVSITEIKKPKFTPTAVSSVTPSTTTNNNRSGSGTSKAIIKSIGGKTTNSPLSSSFDGITILPRNSQSNQKNSKKSTNKPMDIVELD